MGIGVKHFNLCITYLHPSENVNIRALNNQRDKNSQSMTPKHIEFPYRDHEKNVQGNGD